MTSSYQGGPSGTESPIPTGISSSSSCGPMEGIEVDSVGFFSSSADKKSEGDLSAMLESNKDSLKLEAMKRIIGMTARGGGGAKDLFPSVVKNVVSKNVEVKKLVYVYLTRYAEETPDLALLSISAFQRSLKDPNQLIRASALRVLSSIRVNVVVPIVICALKEASVDMSPFVRKTAAHAIPKVVSLDPETKSELVDVIEKLLGDRTTLVVGSAVMAFAEVCPDRTDLIHKHFRKLCNLLVDVEEWGQVVIVNTLTRYARSQFSDPNLSADMETAKILKDFYDEEKSSDDEDKPASKPLPKMDQDHRLLLRSAKPLLQSRNAAVVMSAAQLYFHCAPRPEVQIVSKALIRLLRSHKEVQSIVLNSVASMTSEKMPNINSMFESYLRNFFVRGSDPTHIKLLKLEIITNLATEGNIGIILREFQTYITGQDKVCVAATIQAIGRCAASISDVTDTCLSGLVHLLSNRDQSVVAESVVVIKKLLQTQSGEHKEIIVQMAKLLDSISVPAARAAILWVIGEYCDRVPLVAPDILRKVAKTFTSEEDQVKMQVLNLALKLCLTNLKQTKLIAQYVFNLAKYDANYDIRDRARFLKVFIFPTPGQADNKIIKHGKKIFLAQKPAPLIESKFKGRSRYQLGSLSHFLNTRVQGYQDLPDFPTEAPDPSVRNVEPPKVPNPWDKYFDKSSSPKNSKFKDKREVKNGGFYSENSESSSADSSSSSSSSSSDSSSEEEVEKPATLPPSIQKGKKNDHEISNGFDNDKDTSESEDSSSDSSSSEESDDEEEPLAAPKSNVDLLLDLSCEITSNDTTPTMGGFLTPLDANSKNLHKVEPQCIAVAPMFVDTRTKQLLNKINSGGLQVSYRFTRSPHLYSELMANIELTLENCNPDSDLLDIKIGAKNLAAGMLIHEFPGISSIASGESRIVSLGVNFNDTTQAANFNLIVEGRSHQISLAAPIGELIRAISLPEALFEAELSKLKGMNEMSSKVVIDRSKYYSNEIVRSSVYQTCNVYPVPSISDPDRLRFAGHTLCDKAFVLLTITPVEGNEVRIQVNSEKIVIANLLLEDIIKVLTA